MVGLVKKCVLMLLVLLLLLGVFTSLSLAPLPQSLQTVQDSVVFKIVDRNGRPLTSFRYQAWNVHDRVPLHDVPELLVSAFILSEDKRFYQHHGVDWLARVHAVWQNLVSLRMHRGASTITEQVVRILYPRPRTIWSRWLEGFDAIRLENKFSKSTIIEFYLNQVPYASNRRGVQQAADFYFDRDLKTLSAAEMLALVVMVRAPSRFNLYRKESAVKQGIANLSGRLLDKQFYNMHTHKRILSTTFELSRMAQDSHAEHFIRHVYSQADAHDYAVNSTIHTSLDTRLQSKCLTILKDRLHAMSDQSVSNAAIVIADYKTGHIIVWGSAQSDLVAYDSSYYDAVLTPRQPGSALKPFVYALAMEKGWTAATMIDDKPLSESVGLGLHTYHNYSNTYYGKVSLRESLANSLNIPAVKAVQYVGTDALLNSFKQLGIQSLQFHPNVYGDGLSLGNGEISLLELVQAYAVLARKGVFEPLTFIKGQYLTQQHRVYSEEVTSIIGNILSDSNARRLEFGAQSLLNFPVQTAIKTGTSSDYRDAWAVAYNYRYVAGVWMGNLNYTSMNKVTGASGPALVLRSVFSELTKYKDTQPLFFSRKLLGRQVCIESGLLSNGKCISRQEWFLKSNVPSPQLQKPQAVVARIRQPTPGLNIAMDPRIPDDLEAFKFELNIKQTNLMVDWYLNNEFLASTKTPDYAWTITKGKHKLMARIKLNDTQRIMETELINFTVK